VESALRASFGDDGELVPRVALAGLG